MLVRPGVPRCPRYGEEDLVTSAVLVIGDRVLAFMAGCACDWSLAAIAQKWVRL